MLNRAIEMVMLDTALHIKAFQKKILTNEVVVYGCEGECRGNDLIWRVATLCRKRQHQSIDSTIKEYVSYAFRVGPGIGKNYYEAFDAIEFDDGINYVLICCDEDPRAVSAELVQARGFRQHGIESVVGVCRTDTVTQAAVWTR